MKALQLISHGIPGVWNITDLAEPQPGPEEVVVNVIACGINRLDLWLEEKGLPIPITLPRTAGSEIAGVISALGDDVDEWSIGDRVAIQSNLFCGECEFCLRGEESLCLHGELLGIQCNGGFAEKAVVPWRSLVKLPDNVDFETSAALTLAGSTAMHMLTDRVEIPAGAWVLVMAGASGVGVAAIQIAKGLGAHVISTGSTEEKRNLAMKLGAEYVVDTSNDAWPSEIRKITEKRGVDFIVEHIGGSVIENAMQCLARGGTLVTCGATAGREIKLSLWPFFVKQQRLIGSYGRNRADLSATLDWVAKGRLKPIIHKTCSFADLPEALISLRNRAVLGKILFRP